MQVQSLDQGDHLEEVMATHSSIFAWRIPWTEESGGYSPWGHKELDTTEVTEHACMHCDFKKRFCCVCIYQKDFRDVTHQRSVSILRTVQSGSPGLQETHARLSVICRMDWLDLLAVQGTHMNEHAHVISKLTSDLKETNLFGQN